MKEQQVKSILCLFSAGTLTDKEAAKYIDKVYQQTCKDEPKKEKTEPTLDPEDLQEREVLRVLSKIGGKAYVGTSQQVYPTWCLDVKHGDPAYSKNLHCHPDLVYNVGCYSTVNKTLNRLEEKGFIEKRRGYVKLV